MKTPFDQAALARLTPLLRELSDLKRLRAAPSGLSLAERGFVRAWSRLQAGEEAQIVALSETARCVAAVRLGAIDAAAMRDCGMAEPAIAAIEGRAFDAVAMPLDPALAATLRAALAAPARQSDAPACEFVTRLVEQPRAGATRPGVGRLVLEPPESHADHCYITAVFAVLAAPLCGARDVAPCFLASLAHHFHNAYLPDGGFAGEELLGPELAPLMARQHARALAQLEAALAARTHAACALLHAPDSPGGLAFQVADVLDRVLQSEHYARAAAFQLADALDDFELVHQGPMQALQTDILTAAGLIAHAAPQPAQRPHAAA